MLYIYCVVEGHGDERAFPELIRNYFFNFLQCFELNIFRPYRIPKDRIMKGEFLQGVIQYAEARIAESLEDGDRGLILVTRDSDGACPVELKAQIEKIAQVRDPRIALEVVVCDREFEAWFLASSGSFSEAAGCVLDPPAFDNADSVANPKATFETQVMAFGTKYSETVDQPKFASLIDFQQEPEERSRSLRRLTRALTAFRDSAVPPAA